MTDTVLGWIARVSDFPVHASVYHSLRECRHLAHETDGDASDGTLPVHHLAVTADFASLLGLGECRTCFRARTERDPEDVVVEWISESFDDSAKLDGSLTKRELARNLIDALHAAGMRGRRSR